MARVIVKTDTGSTEDSHVVMEETLECAHLADEHSAAQFVERLGWAISDADEGPDA